jgi:hypothetical protein
MPDNTDIASAIKLRDHHIEAVKKLAANIHRLRTHALTDALLQKLADADIDNGRETLGRTIETSFSLDAAISAANRNIAQ